MIVLLITRRLFFLVLVLFGLSLITFTISRVISADPVRKMLGPRASAAQIDRQREKLGFNDPYPEQYVDYVWGIAHGDFGQPRSRLHSTRSSFPPSSASRSESPLRLTGTR
jgi:ABC-type dipeptide/oligopeptide/nickel transport system permease component